MIFLEISLQSVCSNTQIHVHIVLVGPSNPFKLRFPLLFCEQIQSYFGFLEVDIVSLFSLHVFFYFILFVSLHYDSNALKLLFC